MLEADAALLPLFVAHIVSRSSKHYVEVHSVDADAGVVFDAKIDVFLDAESKVAGG